jgi:hypothetical protein
MAAIPGQYISFFLGIQTDHEKWLFACKECELCVSEDDSHSQELPVQPAKIIHSKKSRNALTLT